MKKTNKQTKAWAGEACTVRGVGKDVCPPHTGIPKLALMQILFLCRFHKLIWGSFDNGLLESSGILAGGGDNGMLTLYNVTHILSSGKEPLIAQRQKHTGAVRALDFNPFQVLCLS